MKYRKVSSLLSLSILLVLIPVSSGNMEHISCSSSGKGTCIDPYCSISYYNSTVNKANFGCRLLSKSLNKIYIKQIVAFKILGRFVPFDIFPPIELCGFVKNAEKNKNSFFYRIMQVVNKNVPGVIHKCPYKGPDFHVDQLYVPESDLALWIRGEYKVSYRFYTDDDSKILLVTAQGVLERV